MTGDFRPAVALNEVCKRFPLANHSGQGERPRDGRFVALDRVSLTVSRGECLVVGGANGSGKSLLMLIIAGLEDPSSGTVETHGTVGLVFQEADTQILGETPAEDVAFGAKNLGLSKNETRRRVDDALDAVGLTGKANFPARTLSGGEKRRLSVAGILAMDASTVILDEPYANLDYHGVLQVNRLAESLLQSGKTLILLTHELEKCLGLADHFVVLHRGQKVFDGKTAALPGLPLERWGIRNPLEARGALIGDLVWR
ncbi:MAG: energy-coupling factor ABC transporter ATP-binding protein [Spirochaetaceae bacterium]|jgi:biotin transport system ATP-binding protein|nr:energy-coupling factor ABC transporter ATP-binding protein [Spirochaetaceae bacterium]